MTTILDRRIPRPTAPTTPIDVAELEEPLCITQSPRSMAPIAALRRSAPTLLSGTSRAQRLLLAAVALGLAANLIVLVLFVVGG